MRTYSPHGISPRAKKHPVRFFAGCTLGFVLLGWMLFKAGPQTVFQAILRVSPWMLAATIGLIYLSIPLRVIQWRFLLSGSGDVGFFGVLKALGLGYLGAVLLPMGGGELVKSYALARFSKLPVARALASVVLVRAQDLLPVLLLAAVALGILPLQHATVENQVSGFPHPVQPVSSEALRMALLLVALGTLGVFAGLTALYVYTDACRRYVMNVTGRISGRLAQWSARMITHFSDGLNALRNKRQFWKGQGCAFLCWALFAVAPIPLLLVFGLDLHRACLSAVALTGLTTLTQLLPITPAALGTYHVVCVFTLAAMNPGMTRDTAMAYALVSHLIGTLSPAVLGLIFLPWTWGQVRTVRKRPTSQDSVDP